MNSGKNQIDRRVDLGGKGILYQNHYDSQFMGKHP